MANSRTRFDTIRDYMVRAHDAAPGHLYGKPCAMHLGHAFIAFCFDGMAFRLRGRVRLQALALKGAKYWDPIGRSDPQMDWIYVPEDHFLRWDRLAVEAYRCAKEGFGARAGISRATAEVASPDSNPEERTVRRLNPSGVMSKLWSLVPIFRKEEA